MFVVTFLAECFNPFIRIKQDLVRKITPSLGFPLMNRDSSVEISSIIISTTRGIHLKLVLILVSLVMLVISGTMLYYSHLESTNPQMIYGDWIETQVLSDRNEVLTLSEHSVLRNDRLVATSFTFDGSEIHFSTGDGQYRYRWNGSITSPQLIRLEPAKPTQTLIKRGYEQTLDDKD